MEEKRRTSKVDAWGKRLLVPAECLNFLDLSVGDRVVWEMVEKEGKKYVILRAEVSGDD